MPGPDRIMQESQARYPKQTNSISSNARKEALLCNSLFIYMYVGSVIIKEKPACN